MNTTTVEAKNWTIAYRNPRASSFKRVTNWAGTWQDAVSMAGLFDERNPGLDIFYIPTRDAELNGYVPVEDIGNIYLPSGKRARIFETAKLPDELVNVVFMEPITIEPVHNGFQFRKHGTWVVVGGCKRHSHCVLVENNWNGMILTEHMTREELENNFTMRPESERIESFTNWIAERKGLNLWRDEDVAMAHESTSVFPTRFGAIGALISKLTDDIQLCKRHGYDFSREESILTDVIAHPDRKAWTVGNVQWSIRSW